MSATDPASPDLTATLATMQADLAFLRQVVVEKLAGLGNAAPAAKDLHETVTFAELRLMLGTRTRSGTYARAKRIGLRPYAPGCWRRRSVQNAIARAEQAALQAPTVTRVRRTGTIPFAPAT